MILKSLDFISAPLNSRHYTAEGIMENVNPQAQIDTEFEHAEQTRAHGNEGQARVCARRAAGIAIREYFVRHGGTIRTPSAYDLLNLLIEDSSLSDDLRQIAVHLTLRVDEEFKLPPDIDLIIEAKNVCEGLVNGKSKTSEAQLRKFLYYPFLLPNK